MENLSKLEKEIIGEIYSSSEAMDNLTILCDEFGGRLAGSEMRPRARAGAKWDKMKEEAWNISRRTRKGSGKLGARLPYFKI